MRARLFTEENRKWWTLGAVAFGLFMIMLDNTIVNVALPTIARDLQIGISELEWVVNGYALTFAVIMLTGGKLADMLGRRRIFIAGLAIFTLSSLACGLASGPEMLIGARIAQGVGAAFMNPATLSIITATFPPRQRGMAIGIWAGTAGMALAIGPLLGGVITQKIDWSWIFFVNVPVGILAIVVARLAIRESRDTSAEQRLDLPGLLASGIGLFALTYGLIEANTYGWTSTRILALFAVAVVALFVFVLLELHQRIPMLDLSLFKNPTFAGANITMLLVALAMFGVFFFVSLYMQNILGYSAIQTGATFLPMTILIVLLAPVAGKLTDRIGGRWLMGGGMILLGISLLIFSQLDRGSSFWDIFPGLIVGGIGMAITMTPTTSVAMGSVPVDKAGVGSAVLNSMRQVGGSLGIAILGAIVAASLKCARDRSARARPVRAGLPACPPRGGRHRVRGCDSGHRHRAAPPTDGSRGAGRRLMGRTRLPAEERRASLLACACGVFSGGSYRGSTTAEIAREAGVTEPVLYRHFESKRDLYLACIDETWRRIRGLWDEVVAAEPDSAAWVSAMGQAYLAATEQKMAIGNLWLQALSEASDDQVIRDHMRAHLREVHDYVSDVIRRSQAAGGVLSDRDADAEAWIFVSLGLLLVTSDRLGGFLEAETPGVFASRRRWLTGSA